MQNLLQANIKDDKDIIFNEIFRNKNNFIY